MATRLRKTDVAIVGLGAAGGLAALPLTRAGLDVVGIEAGGRLGVPDFAPDEIRSDIRNWFGRSKANLEVPTLRLKPSHTAIRLPAEVHSRFYGLTMNAVGGSTVHWTGLCWRFHPWNFRTRSEAIRRYGAGAIPPASTVADWPLANEELEPF
jgi:gluconate 2-dehydrogenase alpha chain